MIIIWLVWSVALLLVLIFGAVLLFGAPYLPTRKKHCLQALKLLNLEPGQTLVDLGCGDGVMLMSAAEQGLKAVGYEINPFLAAVVWIRTRRFRSQVKVVWGNFWRADISTADGVFVFLIGHHMERLDKFLSGHRLKVLSHGFKIPGRKVHKKSGAFFLYLYP
jgi:hypothetical protein